jgi:hypothetical protein
MRDIAIYNQAFLFGCRAFLWLSKIVLKFQLGAPVIIVKVAGTAKKNNLRRLF